MKTKVIINIPLNSSVEAEILSNVEINGTTYPKVAQLKVLVETEEEFEPLLDEAQEVLDNLITQNNNESSPLFERISG